MGASLASESDTVIPIRPKPGASSIGTVKEMKPGAPGMESSVQVAEHTSDPVFRLGNRRGATIKVKKADTANGME